MYIIYNVEHFHYISEQTFIVYVLSANHCYNHDNKQIKISELSRLNNTSDSAIYINSLSLSETKMYA